MTTEWPLRTDELPALLPLLAGTEAPAMPGLPGDPTRPDSVHAVQAHLDNVLPALQSLSRQSYHLAAWGEELARRLLRGQRLLAAGNGGSAAEAQHLTAELVGRFDGERVPFSAISLHAETSAVTAIANDYGFDELFARQVRAHGRSGDVLMLLSTSGKSPNLLRAVDAARRLNVTTWALTGPAPNPLAERCDEAVAIDALSANAQEGHLIALHAVCRAFDAEVARRGRTAAPEGGLP
ncbi:SIS domain-containing protein [Arthrobacter sp. ISL-72]|uniref:D-sedoheptulose-7-phosphate isomerase n=1 Tax=Arthrobacter sp. ISL-72 TaxID=2819114 RepID=UPI001BE6AB2D|nr:SIS domain-containing protein [Arthrobacter sp. ISL-72]MBT2594128.1 SIS domain-containing protein [Arthrobacter sp. ISL-72]